MAPFDISNIQTSKHISITDLPEGQALTEQDIKITYPPGIHHDSLALVDPEDVREEAERHNLPTLVAACLRLIDFNKSATEKDFVWVAF